jgi:hypothetical protein
VLSYQQRELATISALAAMTGVGPQLQSHIGMGINTGITENQLLQAFDLIEKQISKQQADSAKAILSKIISSKNNIDYGNWQTTIKKKIHPADGSSGRGRHAYRPFTTFFTNRTIKKYEH